MGGDSCSEGHEFKSQHRVLDRHFYTFICCKNCNVCLKRQKIDEKEAKDGPLRNKPYYDRLWFGGTGLACQSDDLGLMILGMM